MSEITRTFIGDDIDGGGRVTIEHFPSYGEVVIRIDGRAIAAVDSSEFFSTFEVKA